MIGERDMGAIIGRVYSPSFCPKDLILPTNPLTDCELGVRPLSASVEDCSFGDSGKGHIIQELNEALIQKSALGIIYSARFNGTRNAGHEVRINSVILATHQLPVAVIQEGAIAIMGKGMLVHPEDLVTEIQYVERKIGSKLPGQLFIDQNAVVTTDLHSAFETFTNKKLEVGKGTTGSGVAQGYATWYEKRALTVRDLKDENWREKFAKQYQFYAELMGKEILENSMVNALTIEGTRTKHPVGSESEFLDRLENARKSLYDFIKDTRDEVEKVWQNETAIPFTLEGAQGGALDPYFGIYPDVTASRTLGRIGIPDSTEGVIMYGEIALRLSVLKIPYMSSVGARIPPYQMDEGEADIYGKENNETGRSTGRKRNIYPIDLVLMRAMRRIAQYQYLGITHLDANHKDTPIKVVTHYVDKKTGETVPYRPYQWHWDMVEGQILELPSWDGSQVANARTVNDLPRECLQFLRLLHEVLAPVALGTNGPELGKMISFMPK